MFAPGHVGIALVLYAPLGFILLLRRRAGLAIVGTVAVASLTLLPDIDIWLPWFEHRGRTHTVWLALVCGASIGLFGGVWGNVRQRDGLDVIGFSSIGFLVGTLAVLAHLLGDIITPMGIRPLHPYLDAWYSFNLVNASDPTANAQLFALGCLATATQLLIGANLAPPAPDWIPVRDVPRVINRAVGIRSRDPIGAGQVSDAVDGDEDRRP